MLKLKPYRRAILIAEFIALAVLLGSLFLFADLAKQGKVIHPWFWLIPIFASLIVISGFAANVHIRWIENPDTQGANDIQRMFIYLVIASLYIFWLTAVFQAWYSNQSIHVS